MTGAVHSHILNKGLTWRIGAPAISGREEMSQLVLAAFIIAIGMSVAGMGTHLYQGLSRQIAGFRISGETVWEGIANLFVTFICGPYILIRNGFQADRGGRLFSIDAFLAAFIAFAWSFVTGLMLLGTYVAALRAIA